MATRWHFEVKASKGKQSENQKEFQAQLEAAGGKYILAYSIEDVAAVIRARFPILLQVSQVIEQLRSERYECHN
jgi:hypothetical protein